ncbi:MAG TPA: site-specific integrase [Chitinophagaceae bacterium]|nr:site-specific integrase [Chitinophagaceae bacterium]
MDPKIAVHFIGKRSRLTSHHLLPIYLRVTINGKRFEVATHEHTDPSEWLPSAGKVSGASATTIHTNMSLDEIKRKVYDYKDRIQREHREFNVHTLREKWFGRDRNTRTLLEVVRLSILDLEKLVAKGVYKKSTLTKYRTTERHLIDFLKWRNTGADILLVDLRLPFAGQFVYYLQSEKGMAINSSGKMIKNLKKIVHDCVDKDWLDADPFYRYKVKHVDPKVPHLTAEELHRLEVKEITIPRLATVRDIFVFSCYTGFAYIDAKALTSNDLKIGIDGKQWLIKNRQKTGISERVPVLPPAAAIIDKYKDYCDKSPDKRLLPVASNQNVNAYLKELGSICSIETNLKFHIARHTFATTVTLEKGVPIDSVSKMLGHRSIKTTQIYAQITDKKISSDTKPLFKKLGNKLKNNPIDWNRL